MFSMYFGGFLVIVFMRHLATFRSIFSMVDYFDQFESLVLTESLTFEFIGYWVSLQKSAAFFREFGAQERMPPPPPLMGPGARYLGLLSRSVWKFHSYGHLAAQRQGLFCVLSMLYTSSLFPILGLSRFCSTLLRCLHYSNCLVTILRWCGPCKLRPIREYGCT